MKLISYRRIANPAAIRTGLVLADEVHFVDLLDGYERLNTADQGLELAQMQTLIEAGESALEKLARVEHWATQNQDQLSTFADISLCSPLPVPIKFRAFSVYEKHLFQAIDSVIRSRIGPLAYWANKILKFIEPPKQFYQAPIYYKGSNTSFIGAGDDVTPPTFAEPMLDYECELGVIIGKPGMDVSPEQAMDHVFGYTIFNDVSARKRLIPEFRGVTGPLKGKDFHTGNIMGPWILTRDEIPDPNDLELRVSVNGNLKGVGLTSDMHYSIAQMIAFASEGEPIVAGEFFGTGAPGDCTGIEHWEFLNSGDVMTLEIVGIGTLENKVA